METRVTLTISGERGRRAVPDVLVDTGATLTAVSQRIAEELGIRPAREQEFMTPTGLVRLGVGLATLTVEGQEVQQEVVILQDGPPALLGVLTLEQARFKVDTTKGQLEAAGPPNLM